MMTRVLAVVGIGFVVLAAGGLTGCGDEKMVITQVPTFYTADLKAIAVAPFRNKTGAKGAGDAVSDLLATGLMGNGTYKVYNRGDLKTLMDESDLRIALGADATAAAGKLKKLTQVQAVLVGTVTTYAATTNSQNKQDAVYSYDKKNKTNYVSGYNTYVQTRNEANVVVTAALLRVSDGTTIYATSSPISCQSWAEGSPPTKDAHACLAEAAASVSAQLVEAFAPVRKEIHVDPGKALRTATELYDNKWTYADEFNATDEKMFAVVSLPGSCDRAKFRVVVVRKDQREELAAHAITWDRKFGGFGYLFSPKEIAAKGGGAGEYEIKFYSGPEPIMRRKFKILAAGAKA